MSLRLREVRLVDLLLYLLIPASLTVGVWLSYAFLFSDKGAPIMPVALTVSILLTCFFAKYFLIGLVLLYKAVAPMSLREQCRFEPCCSTYMIIALKKYGLVLGLIKGIGRIIRCRPPNGGIDYP